MKPAAGHPPPAPVYTPSDWRFLGIAFGFSWTLWIVAYLLAVRAGFGAPLYNEELVWTWFRGDGALGPLAWISVLSLVAVYGPALAALVVASGDRDEGVAGLLERLRPRAITGAELGRVALILGLVVAPAVLLTALTAAPRADAPSAAGLVAFLALFFVYQLATSGTEELGWRGYLNARWMRGRTFWDTGWLVGIPWALWHFPVVVFMFVEQGMPAVALIGSLIGFSIGIVAMAILHAWFYERTRSVALNVLIHALFNTLPLATALVFTASPVAAVANIALWGVVVALKIRHDRRVRSMATSSA